MAELYAPEKPNSSGLSGVNILTFVLPFIDVDNPVKYKIQ